MILDILKNLFELAAGNSPVVVIITLATTADAYGRETDELSALMDDLQVKTEATALGEAHSVLSRTGSVVQPAEDAEIAEILKRRLFAGINTEAAAEAGQAYGSLYERLASQGELLSGGADNPVSYAEAVAARGGTWRSEAWGRSCTWRRAAATRCGRG